MVQFPPAFRSPSLRDHVWASTLVAAAAVWLFGGVLVGQQRFGFRDASHFYTPLYGWIGEAWSEGRFPLWNELDQTGLPVAGETTTAIFYPPRWMFALPFSAGTLLGWYSLAHVLLAANGAVWLARRRGAAPVAAFAGVTYALASGTLALLNNPPFLVGAAWLPLAAGLALQAVEGARWKFGILAAAAGSWAMPVLGGDPQTPLHVGVWLTLTLMVRAIQGKRSGRFSSRAALRGLAGGLARVAGVGLLAMGLALPQVVASLDWARHAARRESLPPCWADLITSRSDQRVDAWWHQPRGDSHAGRIEQFSVPPWQWADLVLPISNGRLLPSYRRWPVAWGDAGRIWAVSVYAGIIACGFALMRLFGKRWGPWEGMIVLGIVMATGRFGGVWLLQAGLRWWGVGDQGGLMQAWTGLGSGYGWLTMLVPGYGAFRYPAKWLPVVALGIAVSGAQALPRALECVRRRRLLATILCTGGGLLALGSLGLIPAVATGLAQAFPPVRPADPYWGPLQSTAALLGLAASLRHVGLVLLAYAGLLAVRIGGRARALLLAALVAVDLTLAFGPLVAVVDREQEPIWLADEAHLRSARQAARRDPRPASWWRLGASAPEIWSRTTHPDRLAEVAASERAGWTGRWHLADGVRVVNSETSIVSQRFEAWTQALRKWQAARRDASSTAAIWKVVSQRFAVSGALVGQAEARHAEFTDGRPARLLRVRAYATGFEGPPWRWGAAVIRQPPQATVTTEGMTQLLDRWSRTDAAAPVVVEATAAQWRWLSESENKRAASATGGSAALIEAPRHEIPRHAAAASPVQAIVHVKRAGVLSRPTFQDGHWEARYRRLGASGPEETGQRPWLAVDVLPVDYLQQGVILPAGSWEVEFRYRPWWMVPAICFAAAAWLSLIAVGAARATGACSVRITGSR